MTLVKKKPSKMRDEAAGELYRLAQAQTLIDYSDARESTRRNHKRVLTELCLDEEGEVIPTQDAHDKVIRENPRLFRQAHAN